MAIITFDTLAFSKTMQDAGALAVSEFASFTDNDSSIVELLTV